MGIAIGAGTDVAIESAGIVPASGGPRGVVSVGRLSRAAYRKMLQNLAPHRPPRGHRLRIICHGLR